MLVRLNSSAFHNIFHLLFVCIHRTDTGGCKVHKQQLQQIEEFIHGKELHTKGLYCS